MSITFEIPGDEQVTDYYLCMERRTPEDICPTTCWSCKGTGFSTSHRAYLSVNFSNSNAYWVLEALGLEEDSCGSFEPTWDLYKRLDEGLFTLAVDIDSHNRLVRMRDLILRALARGSKEINWG